MGDCLVSLLKFFSSFFQCWEYMFYTCVHEVPRFLPLRVCIDELVTILCSKA